jgi:hypothetical protein
MKKHEIQNWQTIKDAIKKDHPDLTEQDLVYEIGKEEELLERLQKKLNKSEHEIRKWLSLMG